MSKCICNTDDQFWMRALREWMGKEYLLPAAWSKEEK